MTYFYREPSVVRQRDDGTELLTRNQRRRDRGRPGASSLFLQRFLTEPDVAARRDSSRLVTTARQLAAATSSDAPERGRAGMQALTAVITLAEAAAGP